MPFLFIKTVAKKLNVQVQQKKSDCKNRKVSPGFYKCCYFEVKISSKGQTFQTKTCNDITEDQYYHLKEYTEETKKTSKEYGLDVQKLYIDCGSNYLVFSLLSLILLLI